MFHVFARGNDKREIFLDTADRERYLALLGLEIEQVQWNLLGFCLMSNHVHLLVETPEPNLAIGMRRIHSTYAQTFNKRHRRSGHLFEGRYGSVQIITNEHLLTVVRYIALNPVAAGLATTPARWRWSSHRALAGREDPPPWLAVDRLHALLDGWSGAGDRAYATLIQP